MEKVKIVRESELRQELRDAIEDAIKGEDKVEQEESKTALDCEEHLDHYDMFLGLVFDKNNNKIGTVHSDDNGRYLKIMKHKKTKAKNDVSKIIVYKAHSAVVYKTNNSKKKAIVIKAPTDPDYI